ncbi:MAG: MBL fold metallo-hydrolase [Thermoplasmata archaeon]
MGCPKGERIVGVMKIEFYGGAGTVTGSHYVVQTPGARIGIDAGLFQGPPELEALNSAGFGNSVGELDALVLTHAHIDHSGRLPLLIRWGFEGRIISTSATADLCDIMLRDSAHLLMEDAERKARRRRAAPRPLYTLEDVDAVMRRFETVEYEREFRVGDVKVRLLDAGHILGSAMIELEAEGKKVVFSGDIGRPGAPLLRDPTRVEDADALVLESTYGGRVHSEKADRSGKLFRVVKSTVEAGGNVIIPAFAVGRTQDVLYTLNPYMEAGELQGLRTFVDSPMAIKAGEIYRNHPECFDAETLALLESGDDPLDFPGVHLTRTLEESRKIDRVRQPHIIISASGMCTGGRVLHHLSRNIGRPECTVLFVGYQAIGTLGRKLRDGARSVRILGRVREVLARVEALDSFSAHADHPEIMEWLRGFKRFPENVFLVHGEKEGANALASAIALEWGARTRIPWPGSSWEL